MDRGGSHGGATTAYSVHAKQYVRILQANKTNVQDDTDCIMVNEEAGGHAISCLFVQDCTKGGKRRGHYWKIKLRNPLIQQKGDQNV